MLMGLLHPTWPAGFTAKQFVDKLDEWETDLDQNKKQTAVLIPDAARVVLVVRHAPAEVQAALSCKRR
jgi:hypothetical protein